MGEEADCLVRSRTVDGMTGDCAWDMNPRANLAERPARGETEKLKLDVDIVNV